MRFIDLGGFINRFAETSRIDCAYPCFEITDLFLLVLDIE